MYLLIKLKIAQKVWLGPRQKKSRFWSKFSKISIFQIHFSPNFLQWATSNLTQGCREKIRESPHIFLRLRWLSFKAILGQKRKWNTDLNTWSVFLRNFFDSKKNSQKYWSVLQIGIYFFQRAKTPHFQKQPSLKLTWLGSLIFSLQPYVRLGYPYCVKFWEKWL
jgi:hypothetical protein